MKNEQELELYIRKSLPDSIDKETYDLNRMSVTQYNVTQVEWNHKNIQLLVNEIKQLILDVIKYINSSSKKGTQYPYPLYIKDPKRISYRDFKIYLKDSKNSHLIPKKYTYELHNGEHDGCGWWSKISHSFLGVEHDIDLSKYDERVVKGIRTPLEIKKMKEDPYGGREKSFIDVSSRMTIMLGSLFFTRFEWRPTESVQWIIDKLEEEAWKRRERHRRGY